jgi:V/A-type H+-transporting ATPase subunit E
MDNKLEQLTHKLYAEGLEKGRSEGERIVAEANGKATKIITEAEAKAAEIGRKAIAEAEELRKNTLTELTMAGREAVGRIKNEITDMITARTISGGVKSANLDPAFIREVLLTVAKNWNPNEKISLQATLPESQKSALDVALKSSVGELLAAGIEVGYSADVKTGFRVAEKNGGYYIGFSDESLEALLTGFLREKVAAILYSK